MGWTRETQNELCAFNNCLLCERTLIVSLINKYSTLLFADKCIFSIPGLYIINEELRKLHTYRTVDS